MHITVIGIGAMGCLFGGRLTALGRDEVVMLGHWPPQLAALRQQGLTLLDPEGGQSQIRVRVAEAAADLAPADICLVLVKSYQAERAAAEAAQLLAPGGLAITLQNGLGNWETLAARLGPVRVLQGSTSEGAMLLAPGLVRHAGRGLTLIAAPPRPHATLSRLLALLGDAGFATELEPRLDEVLWAKLAVNAAINPLTALLGLPNGALLESEAARALMVRAAAETAAVAQARAIPLDEEDAAALALQVARDTAANRSSMLQDLSQGRPTEIEAISGAVSRLGSEVEVATPVNSALLALVHAAAAGQDWRAQLATLPAAARPFFEALLSGQEDG